VNSISIAIAIVAAALFVVMLLAAKATQIRRREQVAEEHDAARPEDLSNQYFYDRWK